MSNNHYFYVVECRDGSYYAGYSNDVTRRVAAHNAGKGAKYTKARRPVVLFYCAPFETKREALQAEWAFKQLTRLQKERYLRERKDESDA